MSVKSCRGESETRPYYRSRADLSGDPPRRAAGIHHPGVGAHFVVHYRPVGIFITAQLNGVEGVLEEFNVWRSPL